MIPTEGVYIELRSDEIVNGVTGLIGPFASPTRGLV